MTFDTLLEMMRTNPSSNLTPEVTISMTADEAEKLANMLGYYLPSDKFANQIAKMLMDQVEAKRESERKFDDFVAPSSDDAMKPITW